MDIDLGTAYRSARLEITRLATSHDESRRVPATPAWTIHDVVAHVAGVIEDGRNGNFAGAPGESWTAAQVERGRDKSLDMLHGEWQAGASAFEALLTSGSAPWHSVADVVSHQADLAQACGESARIPADFLSWVSATLRGAYTTSLAAAGLAPIVVAASDFEILRGRFGRRTRDEVAKWFAVDAPEPYLDAFFIFGSAAQPLNELAPITF